MEETLLLTQLSDTLGLNLELPSRMPSVEVARELTVKAWTEGVHAIESGQARRVVMWCPADSATLGRFLAAYARYATSVAGDPVRVQLLVPMDLPPGIADATSVLDLWSHPLLGQKWQSIVSGIHFTRQPVELVQEGLAGPKVMFRSLFIASLSIMRSSPIPAMLTVSQPLLQLSSGPEVILDIPTVAFIDTMRSVRAHLRGIVVTWGPSSRSSSATPDVARLVVRGTFGEAVTPLDLSLILRSLKSVLAPNVFCARADLLNDPSALVAELTSPLAALPIAPLCDELLFVSPRLLTLRSPASASTWEEHLDTIFEDPVCHVARLRWRQSYMGGRPFAQPRASRPQVLARGREGLVVQKSAAARFEPLFIDLQGPLGDRGGEAFQHILALLVSAGLHLVPGAEVGPLSAGQWRAQRVPESDALGGRLQLALDTEAAVHQVHALLHERSLNIGQAVVTLQVSADASLRRQTKDARGRRSGRRPPPTGDAAGRMAAP